MESFIFLNRKEKTEEEINRIVNGESKDIKIVLCADPETQKWAQKAIETILHEKKDEEKYGYTPDPTFDSLFNSSGIINTDFVKTKTLYELKNKKYSHPLLLSVFFTKEIKTGYSDGLDNYYFCADEDMADEEFACIYFYN